MYLFQVLYYSFLIAVPFIPGPVENMQDDLRTYLNKARAEVKVVIKDEARANNAQYQVYVMSEEIEKFNKQLIGEMKEVVQLYSKYESKPEDFQTVVVRMDEMRSDGQKKVLDATFKLRQYMTREEWKTVFGPKEKGSS
jgi:hypothetical protein